MDRDQSSVPTGIVRLRFSGDVEVPAEKVLCHWTRDEVAPLLAGSQEARDELGSQAWGRVCISDCEVEVEDEQITVEGRRL